jgi:hypothetical protein
MLDVRGSEARDCPHRIICSGCFTFGSREADFSMDIKIVDDRSIESLKVLEVD